MYKYEKMKKSREIKNKVKPFENRKVSVFQPFSSRGTFETLLSVWQNLDAQNSASLRILREPCKELMEPVGSAEPRLKNTALMCKHSCALQSLFLSNTNTKGGREGVL